MLKLVIHNENRKDRWLLFSKEISEQGIENVITIPAVTGNRKAATNISRAHKNCVRLAVEKNLEYVLIMEDDVCFTRKNSFQSFISLLPLLPSDWNIFLAGVYQAQILNTKNGIAEIKDFSGLHCYIVHQRFYEKFLALDESINIDRCISGKNWGDYICHLAYPMLAIQHDGWSDNVQRNTNYNKDLEKKLLICKDPK